MLTRARQLDPLDPQYDILMALYLEWGRSNIKEANAVLTDLVAHYPTLPDRACAPGRRAPHRGEIMPTRSCSTSRPSSSTRFRMDPRMLIWNYIDVNDPVAARQVADEAPHRLPILALGLFDRQGDWHRAAEIAYAALGRRYA